MIAKALEHLRDKVERVDVIYICSNAAIAKQNVARLNLTGEHQAAIATRLTLLPSVVKNLTMRRVNFVSFTPSTTFDLKSQGGKAEERVLIFRILSECSWVDRTALRHLLQGSVTSVQRWRERISRASDDYDESLAHNFRQDIEKDHTLIQRIQDWCVECRRLRNADHPSLHDERYSIIGDLRRRLANICIHALEPDLVIIDEFQRFKALLDGDDDAALLARSLFEYPNVRVLLLSATPYRLLSLDDEEEEDHYQDLLRTLKFLLNDDAEVAAIEQELTRYRQALLRVDAEPQLLRSSAARLQDRLLRVMCRTERVAMTKRLDAMLIDDVRALTLAREDLTQAKVADSVSRALGGPDIVEYWKSGPYLLNFQRHYELRRQLDDELKAPTPELRIALQDAEPHLLQRQSIEGYSQVAAANPRLRALTQETIDRGLWKLLWLPPSLSYSQPRGSYEGVGSVTKSLVFSAWQMVPDTIAALCSHEAERLMLADRGSAVRHSELYDRTTQLLRFSRDTSHERLGGMPTLAWVFPSPSLASMWDPLEASLRLGDGHPVDPDLLLRDAEAVFEEKLAALPRGATDARADERWYWAAPALLDAATAAPGWAAERWIGTTSSDEGHTGFDDHVRLWLQAATGSLQLGNRPADLGRVLAELALAAPGVCGLRALKRQAPSLDFDDRNLLSAAAGVAEGFRSLFNMPETIALLRGSDDAAYWRRALHYAINGNIQALLDEQAHVLVEWLGMAGHEHSRIVGKVAEALAQSLSLRTAPVSVDEIAAGEDSIEIAPFRMRCRFALRFGEIRDDHGGTLARAEVVRDAFNSPFRPFILASTSVGQEGLDFHLWCHAVMHWNLPSNPVDLEQREGRVQRYKNHAVRKNLAEVYGLSTLRESWTPNEDLWRILFAKAAADRTPDESELVPFWLFERGGARIERRAPVLPYTRDVGRLKRLKRGLALYRLVFGQPRQEDLLAFLEERLDDQAAVKLGVDARICLEPPTSALADKGKS